MDIKPIRTEADYNSALAEVERLFDAQRNTEEFDRLDVLTTLIQVYESKHYPIAPPDPVAAIEYEVEKRGLTRRDLEPILGSSGRVSEIMNRKRRLTFPMLLNLRSQLGISGDILLRSYPMAPTKPKTQKQKVAAEAVETKA